ncbi:hypothetical protein BV22DRAFT_909115 [Leucogyrophana mollusca]|uniref:Uncharacterized protein n=1 Tax=Leucogyrophana mollusca TaxID=85980 RepID=A0ACB8AYN8_9AGAM|nr:hypothetical protein BV22DRAFT_909115 [Leucogyrophana mollusca]
MTTLEGAIAERDPLISAIPTELGSSQCENVALKRCLQGRNVVLPDFTPLPEGYATVSSTTSPTSNSTGAATKAPQYNPHKDLPISSRLGSRTSLPGGLGSGVTVHTTSAPPPQCRAQCRQGRRACSAVAVGARRSRVSSAPIPCWRTNKRDGLQEIANRAWSTARGIPSLNALDFNANSPPLPGTALSAASTSTVPNPSITHRAASTPLRR